MPQKAQLKLYDGSLRWGDNRAAVVSAFPRQPFIVLHEAGPGLIPVHGVGRTHTHTHTPKNKKQKEVEEEEEEEKKKKKKKKKTSGI